MSNREHFCNMISLFCADSHGRKGSSNVQLKSRRKAKIPKGSIEGAELNGKSSKEAIMTFRMPMRCSFLHRAAGMCSTC